MRRKRKKTRRRRKVLVMMGHKAGKSWSSEASLKNTQLFSSFCRQSLTSKHTHRLR